MKLSEACPKCKAPVCHLMRATNAKQHFDTMLEDYKRGAIKHYRFTALDFDKLEMLLKFVDLTQCEGELVPC